MEEYLAVLAKHRDIFDTLKQIVIESGVGCEGNCFFEHGTTNEREELRPKQHNLYMLAKDAQNVLEIGFNAGHSCALFLLANPHSKITIFDICHHKYMKPCFQYLDSVFPNRMTLIEGDSLHTIPEFVRNNKDATFELLHIDGCHLYDHARQDICNVLNVVNPTSNVLVLDDDDYHELNRLHRDLIAGGFIRELRLPFILPFPFYTHFIATSARC